MWIMGNGIFMGYSLGQKYNSIRDTQVKFGIVKAYDLLTLWTAQGVWTIKFAGAIPIVSLRSSKIQQHIG